MWPWAISHLPIFKWDLKDEKNIKKIINKLEEWVINTFSDLGIDGKRDQRMRGLDK